MNVQVVYCNYQTAGLDVRERLAFSSDEQLSHAYDELHSQFPNAEVVVVSTCNRVELYAAHEDDTDGPTPRDIAQFFSRFHDVPLDEFVNDLLEKTGPDAVRHLFQVASSVDSMVLGEPQVVNQVKAAYRTAERNESCGPLTHALFQRAMSVSGRVRTETRLAEGRVSIASVAVGEFGKSIFDRFDDKTVLIIGAGEMAEETLRYLKDEGVERIVVANRSMERATHLADQWGGQPKPFEQLDEWMAEADVIVSTTGADRPIVDADRFRRLRAASGDRTVFILDLGAPRDFDPAVNDIDDNVFLYDIDSLERTCAENRSSREKEILKANRIIDEETGRFMQDFYHRATGPIVKRLREEWHDISREEMATLRKRLSHLSDKDHQSIERSVERIVNKLLHPPLETLKDEARQGTPHGLLDALRRLFRLSE